MSSGIRSLFHGGAIALTGILTIAAAANAWARPGDLDPGFAAGAGMVRTPVSPESDTYLRDVAIQPDGKVVVATSGKDGGWWSFVLARYKQDGTLDRDFGGSAMGGSQPGLVSTWFRDDEQAVAAAVALQPDGKLVAVGRSYVEGANGPRGIAVARYRGDGSLDPRFGGGGLVRIEVPEAARGFHVKDVAVQQDGGILILGNAPVSGENWNVALMRLMPDGTLDSGFSPEGVITIDIGGRRRRDLAHAMVLQSDGKIVVVGETDGREEDFLVARFNSDGGLDSSFAGGAGGPGVAIIGVRDDSDVAEAVALAPDGKIVVAGKAWVRGSLFGRGPHYDIGAIRLDQNGRLDPSFSGDGKVAWDAARQSEAPTAVAVQADGKVLVAGESIRIDEDHNVYYRAGLVGRLDVNGNADMSFGANGFVKVDNLGQIAGWAMALQNDKIVLATTINREIAVWQRTGAGDVKNLLNDDRLFVGQQFRDFLGREGTASEIDGALAESSSHGILDRGKLLAEASAGNERASQVVRLHLIAGLEMPGYGRYKRMVDELVDGRRNTLQVARAVVRSRPFRNRWNGVGNRDFVAAMFAKARGRQPSPSEIAGLVAQLDNRSKQRADVLLQYSGDMGYRRTFGTLVKLVRTFAGTLRQMRPLSELNTAAAFIDAGVGSFANAVDWIPDSPEYQARFFSR